VKSSKLVQLLSALSARELKSFRLYVASPFFNTNQRVTEFAAIMAEYHPDYESSNLSEKSIFQKIYKGRHFSHQLLRYLMTDLTLLLENFLAYNQYIKKSERQKIFLIEELKLKQQDKYFKQHLGMLQQQLQGNTKSLDIYKIKFDAEETLYSYNNYSGNRSSQNNLHELSVILDEMYVCHRLKYSCEILNRKNILGESFKDDLMQYIEEHLGNMKDNSYIAVYLLIYRLLSTSEEENFENLKKQIALHKHTFSEFELKDIYVFIQNYCIKMINTGHEKYLYELFDTYVEMLESKLIFENGILEHQQFKNIVTLALRINKLDWTDEFIKMNALFLNKDYRKNAIAYNTARVAYSRKNYRDALKLMRSVEFADIYYHLDAKMLLMKIYYETNADDSLISLIPALHIYLKRSKLLSEYQRKIYLNLIKYVKKIAAYRMGAKVNIDAIRKSIDNDKNIADSTWLANQLQLL
jgi:hypothetical protein